MKTVTIEIPDDSELIKEGNIYKICQDGLIYIM